MRDGWAKRATRVGGMLVLGGAMTGCARVQVTRTVNPDATLIDDYVLEMSEKGLGDHADMSGMKMDGQLNMIFKALSTGKILVGESKTKYKGDMVLTTVAPHAAKSGVLYESEKWLIASKASWTKLPDGGFAYELPVDVRTLRPALHQSGLLMDRSQMAAQAPQPVDPEPDAGNDPPPEPIFQPDTPPNAPNPQMNAKYKEMQKRDEEHLALAWKNLEMQFDIVMPGKVSSSNAKSFKDRTATWIIKPYELMQEQDKAKDGGAAPLVLKVTCGAPVAAAKADEERYRKLTTPAEEGKEPQVKTSR